MDSFAARLLDTDQRHDVRFGQFREALAPMLDGDYEEEHRSMLGGGVWRDGRPIFDALMPELLARVVPESLSVLMLLLILSASMSTLAALVLISSSAVVKDLYAGFVRRDAGDARLTALMRWANTLFVLVSVVLAYFRPATIVAILGISWGAIGSVFLGPFLWGLLTRRATRAGALAGSLLGLGVCLGMYFAGRPSPEA